MDSEKEGKRKHEKNSDENDKRREKKSKRARSRSKSRDRDREKDYRRKRRHSKSHSPEVPLKQEKQNDRPKDGEVKKEAPQRPERRAKDTDMLNTRTGGAYIPPARLRMMQAQITDKSSIAYQRLAWEALKKSIHGHINKINVGNIGIIIKELLKENIVRGRGLLCRSVIQAQAASPTFTNVYAALVAAVNSRFPNIGELLLKRLVIQFKRGFKRNDKAICISSASFIAHLVNQRVAHEILALELLTLLVETPTDDSVEVAIAFLKECGQKLTEVSSKGVNAIFEMLRNILHEGQLDKRVQYMIEVMFQVWKDGFKDHPALIEELELVPEEEQFTHLMMLDEATDPQDILNVFKFDDKYEENEQKYKTLSKEILGSDAESGEEDGSGESGSDDDDEDEEQEAQKEVTIIDNTETNLVALRRTIYLTINSSLDFEECAHKLMKMQLKPGQEVELCHMFLDCCAEQRTYEKFYGLLAQRFCNINRIYIGPFEEIFKDSYGTAHRLDTNRLRNVSKFFAHLLFTDSISWEALECVRLNEEDTTSSSRIYIKILFQELAEYMGLKKLNDRLKDPTLQEAFGGIFPRDNPKNTRFSINFFTSIGLGGLTDELREHLKQMPKNVPPPVTDIQLGSESSSDSSSDSSSSSSDDSSDSSDSEDETNESKQKKDKKSKKKKGSKENDPKNPVEEPNKEVERWGHDGFYDTYGKDAQRMDSRPDRGERDFRRPDGRERFDERNGGDKRRDTGRENNNSREDNNGRYDNRRRRHDDDGRQDTERDRINDDRRKDDRRDLRGSKNDERDTRNPDRNRREDKETRDDDRVRRNDDRGRREEDNDRRPGRDEERSRIDRERRDDNRGRKDEDRSRREDYKEKIERGEERKHDKSRKDDERNFRDVERDRRNENRQERDDRSHRDQGRNRRDEDEEKKDSRNDKKLRKDDNRDRDGDKARRDVIEDVRSKKSYKERDENDTRRRRTEKDEDIQKDNREENRTKRKDKENEKYQNGDDKRRGKRDKNELKAEEENHKSKKKDKKTKKKKDDKSTKRKKDKRKREESSSDDDSQDTDSSTDGSSSSSEDSEAPNRYWDNFDVKSKKESIKEETFVARSRKERS